jgi:hypothetical protein
MITISTILILIYAYSIYKIRIDSGSWKDFDPTETTLVIGTATFIVYWTCYLIVQNNILP